MLTQAKPAVCSTADQIPTESAMSEMSIDGLGSLRFRRTAVQATLCTSCAIR
jgi:hypothetical protein